MTGGTRQLRLWLVARFTRDGRPASMWLVLLIILIILLIGALPTWPYSTGWGYYPSGGLGILLIIVLILLLLNRGPAP